MWVGKTSVLPRVWGLWPAGVLGRRPLGCSAASVAGNNSPKCWKCGGPGGLMRGDGFFCPQCRALQPPDPTRDYFSLMDCNRAFRVDTAKLQNRYQQLQRLVHPDFFSQRSQTEKDFSEKHSTLVNDAYKTLLAPLSRGLYLLKLHGVEIPEGTDYEMDQQFLMEIMEINEKLAEAESEAAMKEIESIVRVSWEAVEVASGCLKHCNALPVGNPSLFIFSCLKSGKFILLDGGNQSISLFYFILFYFI
ncbi:iron-sulfur cluster co-chaperone protein HscB isoform X1 [Crocuta crocuta]